ncbi:hypothetical protein PoB_002514000 [Plakobranchus ocellatus]|uniref:Uncharacterized protein n=1 Tax=Plakobranchus ocellatus TaxID=259542 RepID=A0AAV3ZVJ1_9GAST|nr:hypothetical protein PoB_002514000 [Plakobranchus ocellatus]
MLVGIEHKQTVLLDDSTLEEDAVTSQLLQARDRQVTTKSALDDNQRKSAPVLNEQFIPRSPVISRRSSRI